MSTFQERKLLLQRRVGDLRRVRQSVSSSSENHMPGKSRTLLKQTRAMAARRSTRNLKVSPDAIQEDNKLENLISDANIRLSPSKYTSDMSGSSRLNDTYVSRSSLSFSTSPNITTPQHESLNKGRVGDTYRAVKSVIKGEVPSNIVHRANVSMGGLLAPSMIENPSVLDATLSMLLQATREAARLRAVVSAIGDPDVNTVKPEGYSSSNAKEDRERDWMVLEQIKLRAALTEAANREQELSAQVAAMEARLVAEQRQRELAEKKLKRTLSSSLANNSSLEQNLKEASSPSISHFKSPLPPPIPQSTSLQSRTPTNPAVFQSHSVDVHIDLGEGTAIVTIDSSINPSIVAKRLIQEYSLEQSYLGPLTNFIDQTQRELVASSSSLSPLSPSSPNEQDTTLVDSEVGSPSPQRNVSANPLITTPTKLYLLPGRNSNTKNKIKDEVESKTKHKNKEEISNADKEMEKRVVVSQLASERARVRALQER